MTRYDDGSDEDPGPELGSCEPSGDLFRRLRGRRRRRREGFVSPESLSSAVCCAGGPGEGAGRRLRAPRVELFFADPPLGGRGVTG